MSYCHIHFSESESKILTSVFLNLFSLKDQYKYSLMYIYTTTHIHIYTYKCILKVLKYFSSGHKFL